MQLAMIETVNYHRDTVIKYGMNDYAEILMDIEKQNGNCEAVDTWKLLIV